MISSDALFERAAKLPRVDIKRPQRVVGVSTTTAMQSGLYHGYTALVDGVLRKIFDEMNGDAVQRPRVIATGGLAPLIATGSEFIESVDDTLTLDGLRMIYERVQNEC
jgi:type III pantothenate kinase